MAPVGRGGPACEAHSRFLSLCPYTRSPARLILLPWRFFQNVSTLLLVYTASYYRKLKYIFCSMLKSAISAFLCGNSSVMSTLLCSNFSVMSAFLCDNFLVMSAFICRNFWLMSAFVCGNFSVMRLMQVVLSCTLKYENFSVFRIYFSKSLCICCTTINTP